MRTVKEWHPTRPSSRAGTFCASLSMEELSDFEAFESFSCYSGHTILFTETEIASKILIVLEGRVKLSLNSSQGRRLILQIAEAGEFLGLASVVSGGPYQVTAETLYPCKIASVLRSDFLAFLLRHPGLHQNLLRELNLDYERACERLRAIGLGCNVPARLARLLLEGDEGHSSKVALTHEEIGQCIGTSRETVTRILNDFQHRLIVERRGSTLNILNRTALELCSHEAWHVARGSVVTGRCRNRRG